METTKHYKGHRWSTDELKMLMQLWAAGEAVPAIAEKLGATTAAVMKMVVKMRSNGIPLERRKAGHVAGRHNTGWTQGEVEYLLRKRSEGSTSEEIAMQLGRTWSSVNGMIQRLRSESVPIAMRGNGVRKLWNAEALKAVSIQMPESNLIELNQKAS